MHGHTRKRQRGSSSSRTSPPARRDAPRDERRGSSRQHDSGRRQRDSPPPSSSHGESSGRHRRPSLLTARDPNPSLSLVGSPSGRVAAAADRRPEPSHCGLCCGASGQGESIQRRAPQWHPSYCSCRLVGFLLIGTRGCY